MSDPTKPPAAPESTPAQESGRRERMEEILREQLERPCLTPEPSVSPRSHPAPETPIPERDDGYAGPIGPVGGVRTEPLPSRSGAPSESFDPCDLAGDMAPHDDPEKTAAIVRVAYGWQVDKNGRLYGLVAGDMGYAATHIVLGPEDRFLNAADAEFPSQPEAASAGVREDETRPEYPFRCDDCGRAHIVDTVIPSPLWNQISDGADMLCTVCIDKRLAAKGLGAEAEFYFAGAALLSRLYQPADAQTHGQSTQDSVSPSKEKGQAG